MLVFYWFLGAVALRELDCLLYCPFEPLAPLILACWTFLLKYFEMLVELLADCLRVPSMFLLITWLLLILEPPAVPVCPLLVALLCRTGLDVTNFVDRLLLEFLS